MSSTVLLTVVVLPAALLFTYVLSVGYQLARNYTIARQIGLPLLWTPINPFNPLWMLLRPRIMRYVVGLPFGLGNWATYSYLGWSFEDKGSLHARLGPAFVIVTPHQNQVVVADPRPVDELFMRRKDFEKDDVFYRMFNVMGKNVNSVNGADWQRHRKITTPPFNERNSGLVWIESYQQTLKMLASWMAKGSQGTTATTDDAYLLTLNILTAAGFGISAESSQDLAVPAPGHAISYHASLRTVLANLFTIVLMGQVTWVPRWLIPKHLTAVEDAGHEFRQYMAEMVDRERQAYARGESDHPANLVSGLVRASEEAAQAGEKGELTRGGLTDEELYGNLFIYNIAGHETTATIVCYALAWLVCHPLWQEWIGEEIEQVCTSDVSYEHAFPQLKRCLALMHECLRLFSPLNGIPRWTGPSPQMLRIADHNYIIPPHTAVVANNAALQIRPDIWGADALVWRPDRWIEHTAAGQEEIIQPAVGTFFPWALGPRICPGKKFSQVEFVAVMTALFREHRVRPVVQPGETTDAALQRLQAVVDDSGIRMAVHMNYPERLTVRWERK